MEEVKPKTKIRASMPRSKNGCLTCKTRRVKCGEERPTCARCSKTGRKCDGYDYSRHPFTFLNFKNISGEPRYASPLSCFNSKSSRQALSDGDSASLMGQDTVCVKCLAYSGPRGGSNSLCINCTSDSLGSHDSVICYVDKNPASLATKQVLKPANSPTPYDILFQAPGTEIERQLLHYFCVKAAPDLCGYSSSNFWNNLVLPNFHYEPAVRHAALALSAFHREYVQENKADTDFTSMRSHALQQYNKAIHQLQQYLSKGGLSSERTVLVCCALFYCMEVAREDYSTALRHVKSGLVILKEWKKRQGSYPAATNMNSGPAECLDDLMEVFCRLDVQVRIFENGQAPYLVLTSPEERSGLVHCVPATFNDLRSSMAAMDKLTNWVFHSLAANIQINSESKSTMRVEELSERRLLQEELDRWSRNFEIFVEKNKSQLNGSKIQKDSVIMATLIHRGTSIFYHLFVSDTSQTSVEIDEQLSDILVMVEAIMANPDAEEHQARSFTFETGLVANLWVIATNCHNPEMRTRAIELLKAWPRREGLWDGPKVADILERVERTSESSQRNPKLIDASASELSSPEGFDKGNDDLHACLLKNPWIAG